MTCDDNGSFPPEETREKRRELKRTLDVQQTFDANSGNENLIENKIMKKLGVHVIMMLVSKMQESKNLVHSNFLIHPRLCLNCAVGCLDP